MREAVRGKHSTFFTQTLGWRLWSKNCNSKLDPDAEFEFSDSLRAGDIVPGASPRFRVSLVTGGLTPAVRRREWWAWRVIEAH